VSEWNAGNLSVYDPAAQSWQVYKLPGDAPHAYAVCVDNHDKAWVSDIAANAILEFDPETKSFASFPSDREDAAVRQLNGRPGECGRRIRDRPPRGDPLAAAAAGHQPRSQRTADRFFQPLLASLRIVRPWL
jgi:hypothetical protein